MTGLLDARVDAALTIRDIVDEAGKLVACIAHADREFIHHQRDVRDRVHVPTWLVGVLGPAQTATEVKLASP